MPQKTQQTSAVVGVVILDVAVGQDASAAPLHWRAGDWTKPPLDLRLSELGALESIQFDQLAAIALGPLTADEWQMVGASAPLAGANDIQSRMT